MDIGVPHPTDHADMIYLMVQWKQKYYVHVKRRYMSWKKAKRAICVMDVSCLPKTLKYTESKKDVYCHNLF